ncbi:hypothetical protein ABKN59_006156 [Abortiporus biennis]
MKLCSPTDPTQHTAVDVVILSYKSQRVVVRLPETYEAAEDVAKHEFGIPGPIVFETMDLPGSDNTNVRIHRDVWQIVSPLLAKIIVRDVDSNSRLSIHMFHNQPIPPPHSITKSKGDDVDEEMIVESPVKSEDVFEVPHVLQEPQLPPPVHTLITPTTSSRSSITIEDQVSTQNKTKPTRPQSQSKSKSSISHTTHQLESLVEKNETGSQSRTPDGIEEQAEEEDYDIVDEQPKSPKKKGMFSKKKRILSDEEGGEEEEETRLQPTTDTSLFPTSQTQSGVPSQKPSTHPSSSHGKKAKRKFGEEIEDLETSGKIARSQRSDEDGNEHEEIRSNRSVDHPSPKRSRLEPEETKEVEVKMEKAAKTERQLDVEPSQKPEEEKSSAKGQNETAPTSHHHQSKSLHSRVPPVDQNKSLLVNIAWCPDGEDGECIETVFKIKGRHSVRKVLQMACQTFELTKEEMSRARLVMIMDDDEHDDEGRVTQSRFECDSNSTMGKIGAYEDARFIVVVPEDED